MWNISTNLSFVLMEYAAFSVAAVLLRFFPKPTLTQEESFLMHLSGLLKCQTSVLPNARSAFSLIYLLFILGYDGKLRVSLAFLQFLSIIKSKYISHLFSAAYSTEKEKKKRKQKYKNQKSDFLGLEKAGYGIQIRVLFPLKKLVNLPTGIRLKCQK